MSISETFIGIDVSKEQLDCASRPNGTTSSFKNSVTGIDALIKQLQEQRPRLVVLEATGGLERALVAALVVTALRRHADQLIATPFVRFRIEREGSPILRGEGELA